MHVEITHYRGRFAPTPSGPLHFGSMVAAVGSFLDARSRGGAWLVRVDDLDPPRTVPGAAEAILRCLDAFGMQWDGAVVHQSTRNDAYHSALHQLRRSGHIYPCACSRKEITDAGPAGVENAEYPGTCRNGLTTGREAHTLRVRTDGAVVEFHDGLQGHVRQALQAEIGDFVVYRDDHVFAYHLACVVDDAEQGITDVVRGADLIASTPRQIHLQKLLGLPTPAYLHLPVAVNSAGEKLSKQTLARAVTVDDPESTLARVLHFLGFPPPAQTRAAGLHELWAWAISNWRRERIPRASSITAPDA